MIDYCRVRRAHWCWGTCGAGQCLWFRNRDCVCLPLTPVARIFPSFLFPSLTLAAFLFPVMISPCMSLGCSRTPFSTRAWALPGLSCAVVLTQPGLGGCLQLSPLISSLLYLLNLWSLVPPTATPFPCQITATYLLPYRYLLPWVFTLCSCFLSPNADVSVLIPVG